MLAIVPALAGRALHHATTRQKFGGGTGRTLKDNINIVVCYFYIMLARLLLVSCIYVMVPIYN